MTKKNIYDAKGFCLLKGDQVKLNKPISFGNGKTNYPQGYTF